MIALIQLVEAIAIDQMTIGMQCFHQIDGNQPDIHRHDILMIIALAVIWVVDIFRSGRMMDGIIQQR